MGVSTGKAFTIGVEGLDRALGGITPPYVLLIAGNPGAGKTTLASTICYRNTLSGMKCLYLAFYEHKEKLFKYMSQLGLDLAAAESKGLLNFVRLSVPSSVDALVETLTSLVSSDRYDVVVIDSINPLLEGIEAQARRAWLVNFFYNMAQTIDGLLILVGELPYGSETVGQGVPEFVTDAVVVLKQRIEDRFLVRYMEVRKARGAEVSLAEIPFSIGAGEGIRVWIPPVLSEVASEGEPVRLDCEALRRGWGELRRGQVINVTYPPDCRHPSLPVPVILLCAVNGLKTLFVSYRYPPNTIEELVVSTIIAQGVDKEEARRIFRENFQVASINPFGYTTSQLAIRELETIEREKPDAVIFHGTEFARAVTDLKTYVRELFNEINYLKNRGLLVIRFSSYTDEVTYRFESSMADAVMRLDSCLASGEEHPRVHLWHKGREPYFVPLGELEKCSRELVEKYYADRGTPRP